MKSKVSENSEPMPTGIQVLAAACGEKILNRNYLLQCDAEPFVVPTDTVLEPSISTSSVGGISTPSTSQDSLDDGLSELDLEIDLDENKTPRIMLYSQKMKGLKDLLIAEKLNTHAVLYSLLHSQVQAGKKSKNAANAAGGSEEVVGAGRRPKRSRREKLSPKIRMSENSLFL